MKTVNEVSKLTGVSVRALHHYDAIGLLKPTQVTDAGYRLYDDTALARLQTILLFRELQFPLKEIKSILDSPDFNREQALQQQIGLLELQRRQLDVLISFAREIIETGVNNMDFSAFDKAEIEQYKAEVKARWGKTAAYKEFEQKTAGQSENEQTEAAEKLIQIFAKFGKVKHLAPESDTAQALVEALRQYITENYYNCTPQILESLGQMYVGDERFKTNIDARGVVGTAEFASKAIEFYCNKS